MRRVAVTVYRPERRCSRCGVVWKPSSHRCNPINRAFMTGGAPLPLLITGTVAAGAVSATCSSEFAVRRLSDPSFREPEAHRVPGDKQTLPPISTKEYLGSILLELYTYKTRSRELMFYALYKSVSYRPNKINAKSRLGSLPEGFLLRKVHCEPYKGI